MSVKTAVDYLESKGNLSKTKITIANCHKDLSWDIPKSTKITYQQCKFILGAKLHKI